MKHTKQQIVKLSDQHSHRVEHPEEVKPAPTPDAHRFKIFPLFALKQFSFL